MGGKRGKNIPNGPHNPGSLCFTKADNRTQTADISPRRALQHRGSRQSGDTSATLKKITVSTPHGRHRNPFFKGQRRAQQKLASTLHTQPHIHTPQHTNTTTLHPPTHTPHRHTCAHGDCESTTSAEALTNRELYRNDTHLSPPTPHPTPPQIHPIDSGPP